MMRIDRYLLRELTTPFLLGLFALTTLFLINQFARLAQLFVGRGISLEVLGKLLWVLIPPFLMATLPAAMLLAGVAAFSRLSADSELIALRAAGVSFFRLMRPVLLFSLVVATLTITLGVTSEPWGKGKLKHLAMETIRTHTGAAIVEGQFNNLFGDVIVYADKVSPSGRMTGILISDERDPDRPLLVTAQEGELFRNTEGEYLGFRLAAGEIHRSGEVVQRIRFREYDIKLHLNEESGEIFPTVADLENELARRRAAGEPIGRILQLWLDRTRNITFGVACFIFGLLGPALSIQAVRTGRAGGFVKGLLVILAYYAVMSIAQALVVDEKLPVMVGAWTPNVLFAIVCAYVLIRTHAEKPLWPRFGTGGVR